MKKFILSLVITLFTLSFMSCKNGYIKNIDKMNTEVKKYINDCAFKNNEVFNFIEYQSLDYIMKPETYIDSIHLVRNIEKLEEYIKLLDISTDLFKNKVNEFRLYSNMFGINDDLTQIQKDEVEEQRKKCYEYQDSVEYYAKQDSIINEKIKANTNPDSIYMFKVFIKGTAISNNDNTITNLCDTCYYFFDKEFKLIDL